MEASFKLNIDVNSEDKDSTTQATRCIGSIAVCFHKITSPPVCRIVTRNNSFRLTHHEALDSKTLLHEDSQAEELATGWNICRSIHRGPS
eukprot:1161445-Pelagomonas_calceolata.AAC.10